MSIILTQKKYRKKNYEKAKDNLLKCLDYKDSFEIPKPSWCSLYSSKRI